ncbi:GntR family transcriptional regulator [Streptomyces sp. CA-288835]|uniref:GntR family transcriptional regulator n=1 Tax=Streptomyces sp. CA-288835 TaxID=3240069 RepID=UPI003D904788
MPERKFPKPPDVLPVQLPGRTADDESTSSVLALMRHVKEGLRDGRYTCGDILPSEAELQELYRATPAEVREAIAHLRRAERLHLHDEYLDTYFLDPGPEADGLMPPGELGRRLVQLESHCAEILARLEAVEAQLAQRGRAEA